LERVGETCTRKAGEAQGGLLNSNVARAASRR
jgi:hypothetical protein